MQSLTIIVGAFIIAVAVAISGRYDIVKGEAADEGDSAWRLDRWTGKVSFCAYYYEDGAVDCGPFVGTTKP